MSDNAVQVIEGFALLSHEERHSVLLELASMDQFEDGPLSDEALYDAGDEIFAMYDAEEAADAEMSSR